MVQPSGMVGTFYKQMLVHIYFLQGATVGVGTFSRFVGTFSAITIQEE